MNAATTTFTDGAKSLLDYQLNAANDLFQHTAETLSQLAELNLQASRVNFEDATETARQVARARSPQEAVQAVMARVQPNAERMFSFTQHLMTTMTRIQSEMTQAIDLQITDKTPRAPPGLVYRLPQAFPRDCLEHDQQCFIRTTTADRNRRRSPAAPR